MFSNTDHMRVERVGLEHHGDAALDRRQVVDPLAADDDVAAGDILEPGDHAQQGRLAAARRADEDDELAFRDLEVDALDDFEVAERLRRSERTSCPMNAVLCQLC